MEKKQIVKPTGRQAARYGMVDGKHSMTSTTVNVLPVSPIRAIVSFDVNAKM